MDDRSFNKFLYLMENFNGTELGEMLPRYVVTKKSYGKFPTGTKKYHRWLCSFVPEAIDLPKNIKRSEERDSFFAFGETEAEARARMVVYLIKKKAMSQKDIIKKSAV